MSVIEKPLLKGQVRALDDCADRHAERGFAIVAVDGMGYGQYCWSRNRGWSLLKRGMFGQFHSVSRRQLQKYVDEFCYRCNLRNADPFVTFDLTVNRGLGVA